ncbi:MAG: glycosyltransferase, partial [Planctomycetota bacterium]
MSQPPTRTLLILARWFPPENVAGSFRSVRFCRDLPTMGWQCKVITPAEACCTLPDPTFLSEIPGDTDVVRFRCGNLAEHMERAVNNPATGPIRTFFAKAIRRTMQQVRLPDLHVWSVARLFKTVRRTLQQGPVDAILITGPPFSWMTLAPKLKARWDIPVILDFRDAWTSFSPRFTDWQKGHFEPALAMERSVLGSADAVILNTPGAMDYYVDTYGDLDQRNWTVITNGFIKEQIDAVQPESFDGVTLVHGGVGRTDLICTLAEAMGKLKTAGKIGPGSFRFISYGGPAAEVTAAAREYDVAEMIEFRGMRSHDEVLASLKGASGLLLLVTGDCHRHVPGKMYEYLGAGRPILMVGPDDSDAAGILHQAGAGMSVDMTAEAIAEGIESLQSGRLSANINT